MLMQVAYGESELYFLISQTISSIGFGVINKIFLEFENPWWEENCTGIHLVWTENIPNFNRHSPNTNLLDGRREEVYF